MAVRSRTREAPELNLALGECAWPLGPAKDASASLICIVTRTWETQTLNQAHTAPWDALVGKKESLARPVDLVLSQVLLPAPMVGAAGRPCTKHLQLNPVRQNPRKTSFLCRCRRTGRSWQVSGSQWRGQTDSLGAELDLEAGTPRYRKCQGSQ